MLFPQCLEKYLASDKPRKNLFDFWQPRRGKERNKSRERRGIITKRKRTNKEEERRKVIDCKNYALCESNAMDSLDYC